MSGERRARGVLGGAVFLMATSAIGPGFLTQTAVFTEQLGVDFAFVIVASLVIGFAAQANVWRVLGAARCRGQDVASALVPGLGTALALLVAFGGLAFNVGNIAGAGMGLAVLGVPARAGALLTAVLLRRAARASDGRTRHGPCEPGPGRPDDPADVPAATGPAYIEVARDGRLYRIPMRRQSGTLETTRKAEEARRLQEAALVSEAAMPTPPGMTRAGTPGRQPASVVEFTLRYEVPK